MNNSTFASRFEGVVYIFLTKRIVFKDFYLLLHSIFKREILT